MGNPIGDLVKRLRKERELTLRELADRMGAGYSHANISAKEVGRIGIKPNERKDFARAFGLTIEQFDALWRPDPDRAVRTNPGGIPVLNAAPAGRVVDYDHAHYDEHNTVYQHIERGGIMDELAYALSIVGDSMEPTLVEGDLVVFAPVQNGAKERYKLKDGDVVVVRIGPDAKEPGTTVGRYFAGKGDTIEIRKDNKKHKPIHVHREHVTQMGLALELRRSRL